ncbi:MAG: lipid-binding protein, partial [Bacteroidales bacterium]|nr:lipid-binding protein [Bacteroidales bacterium]
MKKYISIAFVAIVLSLGFISCDVDTDEEPGGTKVEKMAGRWNVTLDVYDTDGNLLAQDPYHMGVFEVQTYNTVDNSAKLMWLDDLDTAFRHLDLYDRFGCPGGHVQATFRCLTRFGGEIDPKVADTL